MRTIDLESLAIFRVVAEEGGILRAAEKLHRVPSNVTTRIRQLEEYPGVRLFRKEGRTVRLSAEGLTLLNYAIRLLSLADEAVKGEEVMPERVLEFASYQGMIACVAAGTAFAIVPRSVLVPLQATGKVNQHPLPERVATNRTHLVWRGEPSAALAGLMELLQVQAGLVAAG